MSGKSVTVKTNILLRPRLRLVCNQSCHKTSEDPDSELRFHICLHPCTAGFLTEARQILLLCLGGGVNAFGEIDQTAGGVDDAAILSVVTRMQAALSVSTSLISVLCRIPQWTGDDRFAVLSPPLELIYRPPRVGSVCVPVVNLALHRPHAMHTSRGAARRRPYTVAAPRALRHRYLC